MAFEINKTELVWPGKYDAEGNLVQAPRVSLPFQVIERVNETRATREAKKAEGLTLFEVWDGTDEGVTFEDGWRNKLIWGENSAVMGSLLEQYSGKIDLIYIDPPFDVGADFSMEIEIGGDKISKSASTIEEVAYRDTWGKGRDSFISMLTERLRLIYGLLGNDGQLVVHVDYRTAHYVKVVMDEIFGPENLLNEVIWHWTNAGGRSAGSYAKKHNTLLIYRKGDDYTFNWQEAGEKRVQDDSKFGSFFKTDESGRMYQEVRTKNKIYKYYLDEPKIPDAVWSIQQMGQHDKTERSGFPTQKPESLLHRVIAVHSNPGDLVADFFCGSGTTLAVAEKLGRRWIGADMGRYAIHTTRKRLLEIDKCKPFEVLNLGKYERQYWSSAHFGEDLDGDGQISILEYLVFVLKLYGAEALSGSVNLHGRKGNAFVHVGSVSSPVTIDEIELAVNECKELKGMEVPAGRSKWASNLSCDKYLEK